jgi:hypothetical protein
MAGVAVPSRRPEADPAAAVMDAGRDMLRDSAEDLMRSIESAE